MAEVILGCQSQGLLIATGDVTVRCPVMVAPWRVGLDVEPTAKGGEQRGYVL